jgi:nucleoid DNA-binding protein
VKAVLGYIQTKFSQYERKATTGRNPMTGEAVAIPAKKAVKFKASKNFL